jgi:hypothetical protein
MAWMDPFDRVAYRAMVGRLIPAIEASLDRGVVLSSRLKYRPPGWELDGWRDAIKERSDRAYQLVLHGHEMAHIDIKEYFPSITCAALKSVIGRLPVHEPTLRNLVEWLDAIHVATALTGLPIGSDASSMLAEGLLVPGDEVLRTLGVSFLRYMDDTWCFLRGGADFDTILRHYQERIAPLGLRTHPDKSHLLDVFETLDAIANTAIEYTEAAVRDGEADEKVAAGLELFEYAMSDPDAHRAELRSALGILTAHKSDAPFTAVSADSSLIALAPAQWRHYVETLLSDRKVARKTGIRDWVVERATSPAAQETAYENLVLQQAAKRVTLSKGEGEAVLDSALSATGWAEPVQIGGMQMWGRSKAFKPARAVELLEGVDTLTARRALALTLAGSRGNKRMPMWCEVMRGADRDLEATVAWLEESAGQL